MIARGSRARMCALPLPGLARGGTRARARGGIPPARLPVTDHRGPHLGPGADGAGNHLFRPLRCRGTSVRRSSRALSCREPVVPSLARPAHPDRAMSSSAESSEPSPREPSPPPSLEQPAGLLAAVRAERALRRKHQSEASRLRRSLTSAKERIADLERALAHLRSHPATGALHVVGQVREALRAYDDHQLSRRERKDQER